MAVLFSPFGNQQFIDENGAPLVGGKIYTYIAQSSTPLASYTDASGTVAQTNPIILNARGAPTLGEIWLTAGMAYKFQLFSAANVLIDTVDNVSGVVGSANTTSEWVDTGVIPVYVSPNSYTMSGDQTSEFHIGRRQKFLVTSGIVYGRILTSIFTTLTTVVIQPDGTQVLDSGLSSVQNSILTNNVLALPERIATTTGVVNVYAATVGITRLVIGDEYKLKFAIANDGVLAPTLNLDATGALPILTQSGAVPLAGSINGEHIIRATTIGFICLNPVSLSRLYISGLSLATAGASTTLTINPGQCTDSTSAVLIALPTAISKTTAIWAVGTGNGGLDTGTVAINTGYHFFLIRRPDTGVVDVIFTLSATIPALPANYTQYRRLGWAKTNASNQWIKFFSNEIGGGALNFDWDVVFNDVNTVAPGTTAVTRTLSVPIGIATVAKCIFYIRNATSPLINALFTSLQQTATTPSGTSFDLRVQSSAATTGCLSKNIVTNTSGQIRSQQDNSGASDEFSIFTLGWIDSRSS